MDECAHGTVPPGKVPGRARQPIAGENATSPRAAIDAADGVAESRCRLSRTTAPAPGLAPGHLSATVTESLSAGRETSLWSEAAELYRRVCLLRSRGHSVEAARLQSTELSKTIGALRQAANGAAGCEARLKAVFAREEDRVADASVLAEILLPQLRDALAAAGAPRGRTEELPQRAPAARLAPRTVAAAAPGIADFIDEMIAQERTVPSAAAP